MNPADRQGWLIVFGLSVVSFVTLGSTLSTLGLFLEPLNREFGWSDAQSSRIATAFMLSFQLSSPLIGWLLDRVQARWVMAVGAAGVILGYLGASLSQGLVQMCVMLAVAGLGLGATTYLPCTVVTARWITRQRGLAIGLVAGSSSLGGTVFVPAVQHWLDIANWRTGMQWIAGGVLLIALPIVLFLVHEPSRTSAPQEDRSIPVVVSLDVPTALRSPTYLWITLMLVLANLGFMGVYFHVVPFLKGAGFTSSTAATLYAATNITSFIGYLIVGTAADRLGARSTLIISLAINALSLLTLLFAGGSHLGTAATLFFVVFWGATIGAPAQLSPILLLDAVGPARFSTLFGIVNTVYGLLSSFGPVMTGMIHDITGSYVPALEICAALMAAALIPTLLTRKHSLTQLQPCP